MTITFHHIWHGLDTYIKVNIVFVFNHVLWSSKMCWSHIFLCVNHQSEKGYIIWWSHFWLLGTSHIHYYKNQSHNTSAPVVVRWWHLRGVKRDILWLIYIDIYILLFSIEQHIFCFRFSFMIERIWSIGYTFYTNAINVCYRKVEHENKLSVYWVASITW